ncbi:polysaccharide biosynthesis/export family protein [Acuticoccus sp. MNP-M23]|uniref:polysaccharide biosynthesis/export family protein n=1 Tax=Acuticoccus sp. MNP-M23 TaxID=3072793 RepID=UPI002814D346|nr:polysaccharide biosynthesis/export family protein [Acuticoccus sp. MNP-M23]WMS43690.1 polysaccharide biosynthesis/export family protein [Acuticoccus sp. MNP-M23]
MQRFAFLAAFTFIVASCASPEGQSPCAGTTGCGVAGASGTAIAPAIPNGFLPWAEGFGGSLRFVIGDEVRITLPFYEEENVTTQVAPDGNIYLELIGAVLANGRTPEALSAELEQKYSEYLRFPQVGVVPTAFASRQVYVGGEVENPGVYPLTGPTGVLEAVFQAGGFEFTAKREHVVLIRRGPDNLPMMRFLDLKAFARDGVPTENTLLEPFDIIFVPRSQIAEVNLFIAQYIEGVIPFNQNFVYTLLQTE